MKTYEQALAVSEKAGDHFFVCAFMLQGWICNLMSGTILTYDTPDHRPCAFLQDGEAWSGFRELFPEPESFHHALGALFRFTQYDNRFAAALLRAQVPLAIEQQLTGRPLAPLPDQSLRLLSRTAEFWCDWLEATIHLEIHRAIQLVKHRCPSTGQDDLVTFGFPLCRLPSAQKTPPPGSTACHPPKHIPPQSKPSAGGLASLAHPASAGEEIDTLLIALQPLAKHYHWTSADFFAVLVQLVRHPKPDFCWALSDLETYRQDELGLPPLEPISAQLPGPPAGLALAAKVCPPNTPSAFNPSTP